MHHVNPILNADSYKASHYLQYAPGTAHVSAYAEPRVGCLYPYAVFFGLQMFLKGYLARPVTREDLREAAAFWPAHGLPFNAAGWERILDRHGGFLPVRIDALPEGMVTPPGTAQVQVVNTDPELPWLTTYLETALLRAIWYPTTVATKSKIAKEIIRAALEKSCDDHSAVLPFRLHDFGGRGVSSWESAGIGGAAHLVNFMGTDTVTGVLFAQRFYGAGMPAFSIPAAEHSTITSWGEAGERDAFANIVDTFAKTGALVAVVSDSYDLDRAVRRYWGEDLRERVKASGATIVVRPDSGDPVEIVARTVAALGEAYGFTANRKGYRVLHPSIRVIQGDGINPASIAEILARLLADGWSAENVAFGMGAELLQSLNRDTLFYAYKASAVADAAGVWRDVWKEPKTDSKKTSKRGRQAVFRSGEGPLDLATVKLERLGGRENLLVPVFEDGRLLVDHDFEAIRKRADVIIEPT
jgi:nicotinamide phosphoribosyltransferase